MTNWGLFIGIAIAWIAIACALWVPLDDPEIKNMWLRALYRISCAAVLSPGFIVGHGAVPAPGGFSYFFHVSEKLSYAYEPFNLANLFLWELTATLFWPISVYRRRPTRRSHDA